MKHLVPVTYRSICANDKYFAVSVLETRHAGHIRWIMDDNTEAVRWELLVARLPVLMSLLLLCDLMGDIAEYFRKTALSAW